LLNDGSVPCTMLYVSLLPPLPIQFSHTFQIFVILSAIFWVVSGVLVHQLYGLIECGGVKVDHANPLSAGNLKLSECHELKVIEWIAWWLAGLSVITAVPVAYGWVHKRKEARERKHNGMGEKV